MCELCELCELFVKKLLSKTECAILTDCALFKSSRRSKSFRFLQIISAANKQYAGARAPDRQQAAALAACIPLRCFTVFSAALAYSDIAAVCCDSRIVSWQDGIAPYIISVLLAASLLSL